MKHLFTVGIALGAIFIMTQSASAATYTAGNCAELQTAAENATTSVDIVELTANVNNDCGAVFGSSTPFTGTFDGDGYTVTLSVTGTPLFYEVSGATIQDLTVDGTIVLGGEDPFGPLGSRVTGGVYNNVTSSVNIISNDEGSLYEIGGLIGKVEDDTEELFIRNSAFTGSITLTDIDSSFLGVGGLIGGVEYTFDEPVYVTSTVVSGQITIDADEVLGVGSVVGTLGSVGEGFSSVGSGMLIKDVVSTMDIDIEGRSGWLFGAVSSVGGIAGFSSTEGAFVVSSTVYSGDITVSSTEATTWVGGILGVHWSEDDMVTLSGVDYSGSITVRDSGDAEGGISGVGGLVGSFLSTSLTLEDSNSTGDITSYASSAIYSIGGVVGMFENDQLGDIADGEINATITNVEATGNLLFPSTSTNGYFEDIGGIVGSNVGVSTTFTNVTSSVDVTIDNEGGEVDNIGGIVGNVSADFDEGGYGTLSLIGVVYTGDISLANLDEVSNVAGIIGSSVDIESLSVQETYTNGNISITDVDEVGYVGGIGGELSVNDGMDFLKVYAALDLDITSDSESYEDVEYIGGFIADIDYGATSTISNVFSDGTIDIMYTSATSSEDSVNQVGGFAGDISTDGFESGNRFTVSNAYSATDITINVTDGSEPIDRVGGFIGDDDDGIVTLENIFVAGSLDITAATTTEAAAVFGDSTSSTILTNVYVDETRVGYDACETIRSNVGGCNLVNTTGGQSNYFINNTSNEPLDEWNFDTIWRTRGAFFPTFQFADYVGTVEETEATEEESTGSRGKANIRFWGTNVVGGSETTGAQDGDAEEETSTSEETPETEQPTTETPIDPNQGLQCTSDVYLTNPVRFGSNNNPADVRLLEEFLNTYENANLPVNGIYEQADFDAVVVWQEKHAADILAPWGLTNGTGYVYTTSLAKIKEIHDENCATATPTPQAPTPTPTTVACLNTEQTLTLGMNNTFVVTAQQLLKNLGYFPADIDTTGYFGPVTQQSTRSFQGANGIDTVGYIGPQTRARLNELGCS